MATGVWISVLGIIIASVTAVAVAYMARKQARQIELHRADPSIPLKPPPHAVTRFLKGYGLFVFSGAYGVFMLARDLHKTGPVSRTEVTWLIVDVMVIVWSFFAVIFIKIFEGLLNAFARFVNQLKK